ncbi:hypothetical protein [Sphingobacterium sp.]|jgi:hypothetical protein|uniref:hypothetical protein n=1 Tax=Sphingobacterium sp. TaxID=341027 RepID=UPI0028963B68|nr:hypothetical protein [Sphingobacterium sp.]
MKKIINKIGTILGLVLSAPIKLPGKALNIIRYVALGLGIIESVVNEQEEVIDQVDQLGQQVQDIQRVNPAKKGGIDET